jgi:hypothetical protein
VVVGVVWNLSEMVHGFHEILTELFIPNLVDLDQVINFILFVEKDILTTAVILHGLNLEELVLAQR